MSDFSKITKLYSNIKYAPQILGAVVRVFKNAVRINVLLRITVFLFKIPNIYALLLPSPPSKNVLGNCYVSDFLKVLCSICDRLWEGSQQQMMESYSIPFRTAEWDASGSQGQSISLRLLRTVQLSKETTTCRGLNPQSQPTNLHAIYIPIATFFEKVTAVLDCTNTARRNFLMNCCTEKYIHIFCTSLHYCKCLHIHLLENKIKICQIKSLLIVQ